MRSKMFVFLLLVTLGVFAQANFQGKAVYEKLTSFDMSKLNANKKMSPERKKMVMSLIKQNSNKTFSLFFDKQASIYKEKEKLATPGKKGFSISMSGLGGVVYKNIVTKKFLTQKESFGKQFIVEGSDTMPAWEMSSETKKIGNYDCFKATLIKKIKPRKSLWGNKKKTDSLVNTLPKERLVTAWYTLQIPVSTGPEQYWGLPGLILEVSEGRSTILCKEIVINPKNKISIEAPEKGEKLSIEAYDKMMAEKIKDMRSMYGKKRGRGRRR